MKDKYVFEGDCLDIDIEGISLCEQKIHGKEFILNVKLGMMVNTEQLKELLKFEQGLNDEQWWIIELKKLIKNEVIH